MLLLRSDFARTHNQIWVYNTAPFVATPRECISCTDIFVQDDQLVCYTCHKKAEAKIEQIMSEVCINMPDDPDVMSCEFCGFSEDYPLGDSCEPYDIETEKELTA